MGDTKHLEETPSKTPAPSSSSEARSPLESPGDRCLAPLPAAGNQAMQSAARNAGDKDALARWEDALSFLSGRQSTPGLFQPVEYLDDKGICRVRPAFDPFRPNQSFAPYKSPDELWREQIGEDSVPFDHVAHVRVPNGLRVRTKPHAAADDLGIIPFDTRVRIQRRTTHGWCYITVLPQEAGAGTSEIVGASGFVEGRFLLLDPPDEKSFLHYVKAGEKAGKLVARYYRPPDGFVSGYDAYLFVSALWEMNKGPLKTGEGFYDSAMIQKPVSLSLGKTWLRFEAEEESMEIYLGARLRSRHALWVPSLEKVMSLKAAGTIESATLWGSQGEPAGFVRGVLDGIVDGFKDLGQDAEKLGELLIDIFEGRFLERLEKFADQIGKLINNFDLDKALKTGGDMLVKFIEKWNQPDPYLRGHYQGHTMGYIVVLVLPMLLSAGAGMLARFPRAARILGALGKVMDPAELAGDMVKGMRAAGVPERLRAAGITEETFASPTLKREGLTAEPLEEGRKADLVAQEPAIEPPATPEAPRAPARTVEEWLRQGNVPTKGKTIDAPTRGEVTAKPKSESDLPKGFEDIFDYEDASVRYAAKGKRGKDIWGQENPKTAAGRYAHYKEAILRDPSVIHDMMKRASVSKEGIFSEPIPKNAKPEQPVPHPDYPGRKPRIDRLVDPDGIIIEIKPKHLEAQGMAEAKQYALWMDKFEPLPGVRKWIPKVVTYDQEKLMKYLKKIGFFEKL